MTSVVKLFDPSIQKHVEWLYLVHQTAKNLGDVRLEKVCNINPFGLTIKVMDIPDKRVGGVFAYNDVLDPTVNNLTVNTTTGPGGGSLVRKYV